MKLRIEYGDHNEAFAPLLPREGLVESAPAAFDPAPTLSKLRAPVLALHGANDIDVRATINSSLYSKLSSHPDSRQPVFERADHFILEDVEDADRQYRRLSQGYLQMTIDWLKQAASGGR